MHGGLVAENSSVIFFYRKSPFWLEHMVGSYMGSGKTPLYPGMLSTKDGKHICPSIKVR